MPNQSQRYCYYSAAIPMTETTTAQKLWISPVSWF